MKKIAVHFTQEEVQALLRFAENQVFRAKFIDPKIPGYVKRPEELQAAQSGIQALQNALDERKGLRPKSSESVLQLIRKL